MACYERGGCLASVKGAGQGYRVQAETGTCSLSKSLVVVTDMSRPALILSQENLRRVLIIVHGVEFQQLNA